MSPCPSGTSVQGQKVWMDYHRFPQLRKGGQKRKIGPPGRFYNLTDGFAIDSWKLLRNQPSLRLQQSSAFSEVSGASLLSVASMPAQQIIEGRYVDRRKLLLLLQKRFPARNYAVRLQLNCWILTVPQSLTEEDINHCCIE
ncbi:uncharacterized protein K444DRAFT_618517 [Hyaloscypha bicolor E]|uniref:Uncharacterized protein n=1 Tax=Hyaloscypha bicolor E TaxID=1095630 RepID=A0A2J6STD9_9HELO|nr:uncharacterized protein K444DRAFT_618517 [Hyaloscypha bicolor E]PMD54056.1 hypothetical protein K444DRAFT_618517 [Hyaloscypha bicolor E]